MERSQKLHKKVQMKNRSIPTGTISSTMGTVWAISFSIIWEIRVFTDKNWLKYCLNRWKLSKCGKVFRLSGRPDQERVDLRVRRARHWLQQRPLNPSHRAGFKTTQDSRRWYWQYTHLTGTEKYQVSIPVTLLNKQNNCNYQALLSDGKKVSRKLCKTVWSASCAVCQHWSSGDRWKRVSWKRMLYSRYVPKNTVYQYPVLMQRGF